MELYKIITVLCLFTNVVEGCRSTPPRKNPWIQLGIREGEKAFQILELRYTLAGLRIPEGDQREVEIYLELMSFETDPERMSILLNHWKNKIDDLWQKLEDRRRFSDLLKKFKKSSNVAKVATTKNFDNFI